jgi:hypothetical protein
MKQLKVLRQLLQLRVVATRQRRGAHRLHGGQGDAVGISIAVISGHLRQERALRNRKRCEAV